MTPIILVTYSDLSVTSQLSLFPEDDGQGWKKFIHTVHWRHKIKKEKSDSFAAWLSLHPCIHGQWHLPNEYAKNGTDAGLLFSSITAVWWMEKPWVNHNVKWEWFGQCVVLSAVKDISRILFQLTGIVFVGVVQDREQDEYLISYLFGYTIFFFFFCKVASWDYISTSAAEWKLSRFYGFYSAVFVTFLQNSTSQRTEHKG